jgi:pimeloyl-ACP methyl ester carboxylesterase
MNVGSTSAQGVLVWDGEQWSQQQQQQQASPAAPTTTQAPKPPPRARPRLPATAEQPDGPPPLPPEPAAPGSHSGGAPSPLLSWHLQRQPPAQRAHLEALLQRGLQHGGSPGLSQSATQALLECHYSMHGAFLFDEPLLAHMGALRSAQLPCIAVQGSSDLVCPPVTAWDLHQAWPEAEMRVVAGAGHSMYDPAITHELLCATDRMLQLL